MDQTAMDAPAEPGAVVEQVEKAVERVHETMGMVERMVTAGPVDASAGNRNVTHINLEGAGKPLAWLAAGLAIGVSLGAAVACVGWVAYTLNNIQEDVRNNEAFIQATYQQAPEIRERFDKIKADQAKPKE